MPETRVFNVLNLGAGWQSSRILLGACLGELPKFDVAIFSDTQWESEEVYDNVKFLCEQSEKAGIPVAQVTAGPIRAEILQFMRHRKFHGRKRNASVPMFIKNLDGSQGRMKRQCTKEYKIEPIELWIRRVLLGLAPKQRIPKGVLVRQWFGISSDEASRGAYPGVWKTTMTVIGKSFFGEVIKTDHRKWMPANWRHNVYPLLNQVWRPNRTIEDAHILPRQEDRSDVGEWLKAHYPGRHFPRSACIGCPFRSNVEWKYMRDHRPSDFADACDFDDAQRVNDAQSASDHKGLVGTPFVHRQLVPLRMANLDGDGEKGGGCGTLYDGMDGLCDT